MLKLFVLLVCCDSHDALFAFGCFACVLLIAYLRVDVAILISYVFCCLCVWCLAGFRLLLVGTWAYCWTN